MIRTKARLYFGKYCPWEALVLLVCNSSSLSSSTDPKRQLPPMHHFLRHSGFLFTPFFRSVITSLFFAGNLPTTVWRLSTRQEEPKPRTQWSARSVTKLWCSSSQLIRGLFWRLLGSWGCAMRPRFPCSAGEIMLNIAKEMPMAKRNGDIESTSCDFLFVLLIETPLWSNVRLF